MNISIVIIVLVVQIVKCQQYNPNSYSLGPNLVQNFNFELPYLSPYSSILAAMPGWTCSPSCNIQNTTKVCDVNAKPCSINWKQGLDLCSNSNFDNVSQVISISTAGKYLLDFDWLLPISLNATGSGFRVSINGTAVVNITVTADQSANWTYHEKQAVLELPIGDNTLSMMQFGTIMNSGFSIANVRLQQIYLK